MYYIKLEIVNTKTKYKEQPWKNITNKWYFSQRFLVKKVTADFNGGEITSDAGLFFLGDREKVGIIDSITKVIDDKRHSGYVKHTLHQIISQRVYQIATGYEDGNDCITHRTDPSIKATWDELPLTGSDLSSKSTVSRFENYPC